jgi:hypothetical protein
LRRAGIWKDPRAADHLLYRGSQEGSITLRDSKKNLSELATNEVPEEANEKKECDRSMVRNPRERADSSLAVGAAKLSTFRFRGTKVHFRETSRFLDSRAIW